MARLDAPRTLHHVIVRGIEKRRILDDRTDREALVSRMGEAARDSITKACEDAGVQPAHLRSGARGAAVSRCRSKVARHLVEDLGFSLAEAAWELGVCTSAIWHAIRRAKQSQLNQIKDVP